MIYLIDIGNSRTKYVHCENDKLSAITQLSNDDFSMDYFVESFSQATQIIVANVASANLTKTLKAWCDTQGISYSQVHSEQQKNNLKSAYQEPTKLGIDRWLALVAASQLYPQKNVLIIDAGTATTIDFLEKSGQHQGGWILAGIDTLRTSLLSNSTLVTAEEYASADISFGKNTSDNVHNACWSATLGMIQQGINQVIIQAKLDVIILTGGNGLALTELLLTDKQQLTQSQNEDDYGNAINNKNALANEIYFIDNFIFYGLQAYCK
ncbi:type III pantothenate kinase [Colwellia sp. E2M01]|uniref:type III pantothenate kinase n=1 Tax=Colwellia sp. E2M01 TaxID=2841561 RepID=UPI001C0927B7|nr:type III pantothenate kinase [Colwellia sp. E2M01]MBU2871022.1 type III pantothenate kinase [Colwellia sp. E2M01]